MVQSHQRTLDVKICIDLSAKGMSPIAKRVQVNDFETLSEQAKRLAATYEISEAESVLRYHDGHDWVIVEDQDDLEFACAAMPDSDGNLTFTIKPRGQYKGAKGKKEKKEKCFARKALKEYIDGELNKQNPQSVANLLELIDIKPKQKKAKGQFDTPGNAPNVFESPNFTPQEKQQASTKELVKQIMQTFKGPRRGKRGTPADEAENIAPAQGFTPAVQQFLSQMGMNELTPEELKQRVADFSREKKQNAPPRKSHKEKRALLQSKPEEVIELAPGVPKSITIEILNDTHYPWKDGYTLTLADDMVEAETPIEKVEMPIVQQTSCKSTAQFQVVLALSAGFRADPAKIYEVRLTFRNDKKTPFGEVIPLKVKCAANAAVAQINRA